MTAAPASLGALTLLESPCWDPADKQLHMLRRLSRQESSLFVFLLACALCSRLSVCLSVCLSVSLSISLSLDRGWASRSRARSFPRCPGGIQQGILDALFLELRTPNPVKNASRIRIHVGPDWV